MWCKHFPTLSAMSPAELMLMTFAVLCLAAIGAQLLADLLNHSLHLACCLVGHGLKNGPAQSRFGGVEAARGGPL